MALMLSVARIASLSASAESSVPCGTLAERMMHMSHRFTFTARRSSLFRGQPARIEIWANRCKQVLATTMLDLHLWEVLQCLPLPPDVVHLSDNHHVLYLVEVEVGSSQWHNLEQRKSAR